MGPDNIDTCYNQFVQAIDLAASRFIPLKRTDHRYRPSPPWWDRDCSAAVKNRKEAEARYRTNMSVSNYLQFRNTQAKAKRILLKKKREGWKKFCLSLSPSTPSSVVWKNIKRFRSAFQPDPPKPACGDWVDQFLNKLAPPSVPNLDELPKQYDHPSPNHPLENPFSINELTLTLQYLHDSSPGIDGLSYSMLKNTQTSTRWYLLSLMNTMFNTGYIPKSWKSQIIIPILKPHKDPNLGSSYRPIALSSVLAKITEHLIKNRLEWFAEHHSLVPSNQFGFRKARSTMDNLSILTTDIRLALSRQETLVAAFLDLSAAYDNVHLPTLRQILQQLRIPDKTS